MTDQSKIEGLKVRTAVMGEAFVQRAIEHTIELTAPMQDWINAQDVIDDWQQSH